MSSSAPLDARLGPRRRALVFAALCGLLFVASMLPRASYTVDDAFIYQRFARNALAGEGLVFNPGEAVEGYSSPLWMLLLWLGASLGAKGFVFARLLGIACTLAAVGSFAYLLARRCRPGLALGVGALFALSPGLAWWSGSGMDTPLVVLLMVFFVVGLFDDSPRWVLSAAALLAIARPEGPIFLVVAWAWLIGRARAGKLSPRRAWLAASAGAAPLLAWLVFRRISYGAWLANSAWAKLGRPATPSSADYGALEYWGEILMRAPASVIALAAGLVALRSMQDAELRRRLAWLGAPVLAGTAFLTFVGGDWMPWPRFWLHLLPAPFFLFALAGNAPAALVARRRLALLATATLATFVVQARDFSPEHSLHARSGLRVQAGWLRATELLQPLRGDIGAGHYAEMMLRHSAPGDWVVHIDIGQSAYFAEDLRILDSAGLVTRPEAEFLHDSSRAEALRARVEALHPAVVFLLVDASGRPVMPVQAALAPAIWGRYQLVDQKPWWGENILRVYVASDRTQLIADPERWRAWQAASPGLELFAPGQAPGQSPR